MSSRKRKSSVWNFFLITDTENHLAICNTCQQTLCYKSSVSNLKKHLQRKHHTVILTQSKAVKKNINKDYFDEDDKQHIIQTNVLEDLCTTLGISQQAPQPGTTSPSTSKVGKLITKRKSIKRPVRKISNNIPIKLSDTDKQKIDNELLKLFYLDYQPFRIVEDKGFQMFVKILNPNYELPSRKTISETLLPSMYDKCMFNVREMLQNLEPYVCLTTDCWTSLNNESYMAITVHFLDKDFEMHSVLLNCEVFYENHTSEDMAKELLRVTEYWDLEEKIILAVSDNTADIKSAITSTSWEFFACYADTLNLVVQDALKLPQVKTILEKVKVLVSHFKRSSEATSILSEVQKNCGIHVPKKLLQDVVTRWNSTFYMLERFIELEVPLRSTVDSLDVTLPTLSMDDWEVLKELCKILRPFDDATCSISGENYMAASLVIVITNGLLDVCRQLLDISDLSDTSKTIIIHLEAALCERLDNVEYCNTLAACTFLDPRFKTYCFKNVDAVERVRKSVIDDIVDVIEHNEEKESCRKEPDSKKVKPNNEEKEVEFSIWSSFDVIISERQKTFEDSTARALIEVQRYMEDDLLERNKNPMQWWKEHNCMYPNLSKLVQQKCCALATSVPGERLFSKAGNLLNDKRTCLRLSAEKVQQILFVNVNSKFISN